MRKKDSSSLLKIAEGAALQAGKFLAGSVQVDRRINQDLGHDVKIEADRQSEKIILDFLKEKSDLPVLSEEMGYSRLPSKGSFLWVVDPIDGSINFSRQIPLSCVSIGLWQRDKPLLGVVYDFYRSELFSGIASQGAWLNGVPIRVSQTSSREKAVLFCGFPAATDLSQDGLRPLLEQIQVYRKLRWIGSAALSLAYVACGRGDVYYERGIMIWDAAAGIPIVLGAGGLCHYQKSKGDFGYNVFASNGHIEERKFN